MPSLLKDRPSGRLGRLLAALSPARAGPLPVQTGFPTSLADLVVKNHGRLKKPSSTALASSKRKKRGVSPSPSPTPSPPAAAVSPSAQPRPDLLPVQAVRHSKGGVFGLGLGFLALGGVVSLAVLVIWSKKVVAAVTFASFSLFLLESVRSSALPRRPRPVVTKKLDLDGRGYVSPIREVGAETEPPRPSCSDSDRGSEVSILAVEERSEVGDDSNNPKAKTKKRSWKKLIANKLHKGRKCKDADSSGSFRSESNQADAMVDGNARSVDSSDSRQGKANQADAMADAIAKSSDSCGSCNGKGNEMDAEVGNNAMQIEIDASADLTESDDGVGSRFPVAVVVAVVLVGLVAGKHLAVAFTVLCSVFLSSVQRFAGRWWRCAGEVIGPFHVVGTSQG